MRRFLGILRERHARRRRIRGQLSRVRERGVAMLMAAVGITFVAVFTVEFATNTNVEWAAATNARDDMRGHFMARSGMNLAELIIKVQTKLEDIPMLKDMGIQITDYVPLFMGAFGGSAEETEDFGKLLGLSGDDLKGLGTEIGTFSVDMTTDDGKINVNCVNNSRKELQDATKSKLDALVYFEMYNPVFENADAEGWRRDRAQQVAAIVDYIDTDRTQFDARGTAEDYGYQSLSDRYNPKNNYMDTVGELKLVRGVDDRFWSLFGDQLTVYGGCKANLRDLVDPKLIMAIIYLAAKDRNDTVINDFRKLAPLAARVAEARQWGIIGDTPQDFAEFVKDPNGGLAALAQDPTSMAQMGAPDPTSVAPVEGVELDINALQQITESGKTPRRTYRVTARAEIDTLVKTIEGVWDQKVVRQQPRRQGKGAWVFWREE